VAHPKAVRPEFSEDAFRAWLPANGKTFVGIKRDGDQWYAVFLEFNIAGTGASQREAVKDATRLLATHLVYSFTTGKTFEESRRPVPRRLQAWIRFSALLARFIGFLHPAFTRVKQRPFDHVVSNHPPLRPAS
jgi:hypothetical protein